MRVPSLPIWSVLDFHGLTFMASRSSIRLYRNDHGSRLSVQMLLEIFMPSMSARPEDIAFAACHTAFFPSVAATSGSNGHHLAMVSPNLLPSTAAAEKTLSPGNLGARFRVQEARKIRGGAEYRHTFSLVDGRPVGDK